jgi:hypothetical protein
MSVINTEEAARRLARVILSDIELYNGEKIRAGQDLRREINEGYKLFRSRVAPELVSIFAAAVSQKRFGAQFVPPPPPAPRPPWPRPTVPQSSDQEAVDTVEAAKRLAALILLEVQASTGKVADGAVLRFEIEEGRARFESRVPAHLASVFDELLVEMGLAQEHAPAVEMTGEQAGAGLTPPRPSTPAEGSAPPFASPSPSWDQPARTPTPPQSPSMSPSPSPSPSWHPVARVASPDSPANQPVASAAPPSPSWRQPVRVATPTPPWRSIAPAMTPAPGWQATAAAAPHSEEPGPTDREPVRVNPATRSSDSWNAQPAPSTPYPMANPASTGAATGEPAVHRQPVPNEGTASPAPLSMRARPSPAMRILTTLVLLAAAAGLVYLFLSP